MASMEFRKTGLIRWHNITEYRLLSQSLKVLRWQDFTSVSWKNKETFVCKRNLTDYITVIFLQATYKRHLQSIGLPIRMSVMHKTQSDHVRLHLLLSVLLWSCMFDLLSLQIYTTFYPKYQHWAICPWSEAWNLPALPNLWLLVLSYGYF